MIWRRREEDTLAARRREPVNRDRRRPTDEGSDGGWEGRGQRDLTATAVTRSAGRCTILVFGPTIDIDISGLITVSVEVGVGDPVNASSM